jgi:hypothetical protein
MNIEFKKQHIEGAISTGDEIELYNCEDHQMNGNYIVASVEAETSDVTLVGTGGKSGCVTVICLGVEGGDL